MIVRWSLNEVSWHFFVRQLSCADIDLVQLAKRDRSRAIKAQAVASGSPRLRLDGGTEDVFSMAWSPIASVS